METENKMDMEQFAENIKVKLEQNGQFKTVSLQKVLKNNGIMRCGLLLQGGGGNLVPTIYLEAFFEAYREGADMGEIAGRIRDIYESSPCGRVDMSFLREFPKVKDRLCMKLVNREANEQLLAEVPHREFLDMAVVYYVDYDHPQVGPGTIQVYNSHMKMWGVTEEDLRKTAGINTPLRKPGRIADLGSILAESYAKQESGNSGSCRCGMEENPGSMLIITNADRRYGAAVVLYSGMLKQAADKTDSDLFILPSSLHEVIAVPATEERTVAELKEMVMEVNRKHLEPEDVLSDNVYIYRREQDRMEIA